MELDTALEKISNVCRLRHLSLSTEENYRSWVKRYARYVKERCSPEWTSERKMEAFLTQLATQDVSASTQNQAFCALVFLYRECLGVTLGKVESLRAKKPVHLRYAPEESEVRALLAAAKGGKDRFVSLPCCLFEQMRAQMEYAKGVAERDRVARVPVALPGLLASKYPHWQFSAKWGWVFPSHKPCVHPRTKEIVRWRCHEANVQRCVRQAARPLGLDITPHHLRHAYATHCLNRGGNPRAIQEAMGHSNLETTMGYMHADAMSVRSPLEL